MLHGWNSKLQVLYVQKKSLDFASNGKEERENQ